MTIGLAFVLAVLVIPFAAGQSPGNLSSDDFKGPDYYVRVAADVALNIQADSLNGFLGVYISPKNWDSASKDSDLSPFMKLKQAGPKAGRSAACLFSSGKDAAVCVYFDGDVAFGVATAKAAPGKPIAPADIDASYKPVTREMLKTSDKKLHFTEGTANTDDGAEIPAFALASQ